MCRKHWKPCGRGVVDILEHDDRESGVVYVGPAMLGWTSVVGPRCDAFGSRGQEAQATIERLSAQFGEAHAFYFGAQGVKVRPGWSRIPTTSPPRSASMSCGTIPVTPNPAATSAGAATGRPCDAASTRRVPDLEPAETPVIGSR
jgi:hypothetical protein